MIKPRFFANLQNCNDSNSSADKSLQACWYTAFQSFSLIENFERFVTGGFFALVFLKRTINSSIFRFESFALLGTAIISLALFCCINTEIASNKKLNKITDTDIQKDMQMILTLPLMLPVTNSKKSPKVMKRLEIL